MSFDPSAISGLSLWLKADAIVGLSDGAAASTWPDSSGNGFSATASGAATYHTNQRNGLPALTFDTTDTYSCPQEGSYPTGVTIFTVINPASFAGNPHIYSGNTTGGMSFRLTTAGKPQMNKVNVSQIGLGAAAVTLGQWVILTSDFADSGTGAAWDMFTNGAANGSGTIATQFTASITGSFVGHRPGGSSTDNWNGQIAELLIYERVLTATERAQVHSYLQDKYAITVADYIPSGHTVAVGQAVENDTAPTLTLAKTRAIGQATETDAAEALAPTKTLALGRALETGSAPAIAALKLVTVGQAVELDTSRGTLILKALTLGRALETDTAQAIAPRRRRAPAGEVRVIVADTTRLANVTDTRRNASVKDTTRKALV